MAAKPYYGSVNYIRDDGTKDDGEGRRRRVGTRRTVDYGCTNSAWLLDRLCRRNAYDSKPTRPALNDIINMKPASAYDNPATSLAIKYVHTSTNKNKFSVNVVKVLTPKDRKWPYNTIRRQGRRLLTGASSGEFTLWNGMQFNFETILQAHDEAIRCLQWSHNGDWLLSGDTTGLIKYWQPNMNNVKVLAAHRDAAVRDVSFSPNDTKFVSAGDDNLIKIWDFNEAIEIRTLTGHGWEVRSVDWHPTKGLIASGSKDNLLKLWDPRTSRTLSTLHFHKNTVGMVRFQPHTGNLLASASRDGTCRILDLRTMKDFRILRGHEKDVSSVAWHPIHTSLIVTGGADGAIHHYLLDDVSAQHGQTQASESSAITMQPTASVQYAHEFAIWSLDWHPQGHMLCSGSNDRATRFWARTRPGDPMFMKDRYHLGQEQADAMGYTRRSAMKREEEEEQEDESNALVDQQMPLADQVTSAYPDAHGMNVPGLSVPGLNFGATSNGIGLSMPAGLDLNSLPGLLQSFGGAGGGAGLLPGLGLNRGAPLPMQTEAFHSERQRNTRDRDRSRDSRDRSPPRRDRDRNWDNRGRRDRDRDGYGRR